jgi:hypothetical protein
MQWNEENTDDKGRLTVTRHSYAQTKSSVRVLNYDVASGARVQSFLKIIGEKKRQDYEMTSTGVGCRFWVYCHMPSFPVEV